MPASIKYHYAQLENGQIVSITEVTRENRAAHYFCVGCGEEMSAVLGNKREHHFRHKEAHCSWESYLHKLGKKIIKQSFENSSQFFVRYYARYFCNKWQECKLAQQLASKDSCNQERLHSIDLKEFYDTIEEEATYKYKGFRFRADLMLSSKEHPERKPVFIEISVTHDCEEKKIDSGIRIIELKLNNEQMLPSHLNEAENIIINETREQQLKLRYLKELPIRFYNFKRSIKSSYELTKFYIVKDKNGVLRGLIKNEVVDCHNVLEKHINNSLYEISIPSFLQNQLAKRKLSLYEFGFIKAIKSEIKIKHCELCKNKKRCYITINNEIQDKKGKRMTQKACLYKYKIPNEQRDKEAEAYNCEYYSINMYIVEKKLLNYKDLTYWEWKKQE